MSISQADFEYVCELVRSHSGIVLGPAKTYLVEGRLSTLARREGVGSIDEIVRRLREDRSGALERKVVEAMTTNETSFFRDPRVFELLRSTILPELIETRSSSRELNLWCAASATGQEPYSLAMLLREHFPDLRRWRVRLLASDLSSSALDRARAGAFRATEIRRGLPVELRDKYFDQTDEGWTIDRSLRDAVRFRRINLARGWPDLPPMDAILLRNVLMYFDVETKRTILGKARSVLREDGYLLLGGAETTLYLEGAFERAQWNGAACYRPRAGTRGGEDREPRNGHARVLALAGSAADRDRNG